MQPRQLQALKKRWDIAEENREFMPAQIAAATVNFSMGAPKKKVHATDFMPTQWGKKLRKVKQPRMRSRKVIAAEIEAAMEAAMAYQKRQQQMRG